MKILVLLKETFDTSTEIKLINSEQIDEREVTYIINPYDEYALEEAIRIKEALGGEVVLFTVGREEAAHTIRKGLALGADRAILIKASKPESREVSSLLAQAIKEYERDYTMILCGWMAVDDNNGQVPARLSSLLHIPFVNVVTKLELKQHDKKALCQREGEGQSEIVEVALPALVAVQKGINVPRYPTVPNILQARKKPLRVVEGGKSISGAARKATYELPKKKREGLILGQGEPALGVKLLVEKLLAAKVL